MHRVPTHEGRRSKRVMLKRRASLVVNLDCDQKRFPCLVLDSSKEGFRLRGSFHLRREQLVEVVLDSESFLSARCRVVWVGRAGSRLEGEVGLEIVESRLSTS
jgi:hypothetical protein